MNLDTPEDAGMSSDRLARIAPIMEDFVKDNRLPGVMTLLKRRGKIVHFGKFGLMDIEAGRPMEEDAIFRIYSMTKPITSVAIMMLLEEGRVGLTDLVSRYIPAFGKTKVYAGMGVLGLQLVNQQPEMTLHHLMTHTSGLSYGWYFDSPVEALYRQSKVRPFDRDVSLQEIIESIAEIPLLFQPGTQWRYSIATDVLGHIVQVVSGMPLDTFFKERIFIPLGMDDTDFYVPADKVGRLAQIYGSEGLFSPQPIPPEAVMGIADITRPTKSPAGGGGLASTLADYLKFCDCLLANGVYDGGGGGGRLISRKTLAWMTANHIPDALMPIFLGPTERDHGFGLGFRVTTDLGKRRRLSSVGEFGWGGAANTYFWIDPAEELIGLMMTQHMPLSPYPVTERFRNMAYQAIAD